MVNRPAGHVRATVSVLAVLTLATLAAEQARPQQNARPRRIAVFGSSVASGTGDELRQEGYAGRLRDLLVPSGWEVVNQSRGGDSTVTMAERFAPEGAPNPAIKYLLPANPGYVAIGLSLGNEGIANVKTVAEKDAVFTRFANGIRGFITRSRQNGIVAVVTLCYTRNDFTDVEYAYTRRMNLLVNSWDVPSVNFLGAVDDGTGKWVDGFWTDALHPTAAGHAELTTTFVPTLFEALEKDKPLPARSTATGFARVSGGPAAMTFAPPVPMHPFAISLNVRSQAFGTVVTISGSMLNATSVPAPARGRGQASGRKLTTLSAGGPFAAAVGVRNGMWTYTSSTGAVIASAVIADASWHQITVSHYTARGETLFFVDGRLAGKTPERLEPKRFVVGGPGDSTHPPAPRQVDYKDLLIYRSALNPDEAAALQAGTLLQASLEIYAPLTDARFPRGAILENRAQSLSGVTVEAGTIAHAAR